MRVEWGNDEKGRGRWRGELRGSRLRLCAYQPVGLKKGPHRAVWDAGNGGLVAGVARKDAHAHTGGVLAPQLELLRHISHEIFVENKRVEGERGGT